MKRDLKIQRDIRKKKIYKNKKKFMKSVNNSKLILDELIKKPLIKQRTAEWFKLREDKLTASDLYDAIKNPLSLAKRKLKGSSFNSSSIPALKWGVMFEPIATQIYSHMKNKKIHEFGLIINDDIEHFGASPDGITEDGVMIEIKCPYSRKIIDGEIPEKYYYQIQGQLAVCKLEECDYIECEFTCIKSEEEYLEIMDEPYTHGIIAEIKSGNEYIYEYSTENQSQDENINEMKQWNNKGYNLIYWKLKLINIQNVKFNRDKWNNEIIGKINKFYDIYCQEKKNSNPINQFIEDD
jgi:putative phage-type endonuclease